MRNVIITGGELFNKGAQAMTFIAVDEMKKRFPGREIYVLSAMDLQRPEQEQKQYAFRFTGWYPLKFAKAQSNPALRLLCRLRNREEFAQAETLYKNCDMMVDISGYALGSNWGDAACSNYLDHLEYARAFEIPVYLMPQSFGPFRFRGKRAKQLEHRMKHLLPGVKVICAREQEGYDVLTEKYGLTNVQRKPDLVLNNRSIHLENIYDVMPQFVLPDIAQGSVGIIPNIRTVDVSGEKTILRLYYDIISDLIHSEKTVYLLSHSTQDKALCAKIRSMFDETERLILLDRDFSCLEFHEFVGKFQFVIASRFHSIVHAYKNGVPCIALGWAVKYHDLLTEFGQEQYAFDAASQIDTGAMRKKIAYMSAHAAEESAKIKAHLAVVQRENVFDILPSQI